MGTAATGHLLAQTGLFLDDQGATAQAIVYLQRSLTASQRLHGADHPDMLTYRNNLAYAYELVEDLGRAVPMYERTVTDCVRVLGDGHPTTKVVKGNLDAIK